jgi:hypothetical protein
VIAQLHPVCALPGLWEAEAIDAWDDKLSQYRHEQDEEDVSKGRSVQSARGKPKMVSDWMLHVFCDYQLVIDSVLKTGLTGNENS